MGNVWYLYGRADGKRLQDLNMYEQYESYLMPQRKPYNILIGDISDIMGQVSITQFALQELSQYNPNVEFINYYTDTTFDRDDYWELKNGQIFNEQKLNTLQNGFTHLTKEQKDALLKISHIQGNKYGHYVFNLSTQYIHQAKNPNKFCIEIPYEHSEDQKAYIFLNKEYFMEVPEMNIAKADMFTICEHDMVTCVINTKDGFRKMQVAIEEIANAIEDREQEIWKKEKETDIELH